MQENLEQILKQTESLRDAISQLHDDSKQMGYNSIGIRECALTINSCLKKVGNNRMAALSARDTRKVMAEMEEAVERLLEFTE